MRQYVKIRGFGFALLLSTLFVLTTTVMVWSQNAMAPRAATTGSTASGTTAPAASASVAPAPAASAASSNESASSMSTIVIGSGDLLKVSVFGAPESDQEVRVDPDGNVSLNFIGSVHLAGLSNTAAQDLIAKKLKDGGFFAQPQVSVFTKEYATQGVSVLGEVQKPGVYPMLGSRRLFDVISMAGGTSPKAGRIVAISHRDHPEAPLSYTLSNDPTESAKSNVEVFPGDTVVVARAGIVYVVGDVHKPSGVLMDNGTNITVLQAIAMAEGTNNTAALNKAKLIRTTATGRQELPLPLKDMLESKIPDMRLQAEDIIFVPNSAAKSATRRTLEAIVQTATGVAVYGVYR